MRKTIFAEKEFYHLYNRGVDKRNIFMDEKDVSRFFQSMSEFNALEPIGSIYENSFVKKAVEEHMKQKKKSKQEAPKLVNFVAYCLNPNHFHFLVEQVSEKGIEKLMQRIGNGYSKYFNHRNKRSGSLFQGPFQAAHIDSNEYLLHVSSYVNLNDRVHGLGHGMSKLVQSSWSEYASEQKSFCDTGIILEQFKTLNEYKEFAESSLEDILLRRKIRKELEGMLLE